MEVSLNIYFSNTLIAKEKKIEQLKQNFTKEANIKRQTKKKKS